jgi:hypothetical protein
MEIKGGSKKNRGRQLEAEESIGRLCGSKLARIPYPR